MLKVCGCLESPSTTNSTQKKVYPGWGGCRLLQGLAVCNVFVNFSNATVANVSFGCLAFHGESRLPPIVSVHRSLYLSSCLHVFKRTFGSCFPRTLSSSLRFVPPRNWGWVWRRGGCAPHRKSRGSTTMENYARSSGHGHAPT